MMALTSKTRGDELRGEGVGIRAIPLLLAPGPANSPVILQPRSLLVSAVCHVREECA
jgi:hypothetical protein